MNPGETAPSSTGLLERGAQAFAASVPERPADDGLFGPRSVTWRLTGSMTTPVIGIRALLLQALHPLAMAGVDQHSSWRADPGARLASTSAYEVTVSVGDTAAASAAAARVRKIHSYVKGTDPATRQPYAAGDPALLLWVHNALVDSTLACTRLYGSISAGDADSYLREQVAAAELIGIPAGIAPRTVAELDAYFEAVRPELMCTPAAASATSSLLDYVEGPALAATTTLRLRDCGATSRTPRSRRCPTGRSPCIARRCRLSPKPGIALAPCRQVPGWRFASPSASSTRSSWASPASWRPASACSAAFARPSSKHSARAIGGSPMHHRRSAAYSPSRSPTSAACGQ